MLPGDRSDIRRWNMSRIKRYAWWKKWNCVLIAYILYIGETPFGICLPGTELLQSPFRTEFSLGSLSWQYWRSLCVITNYCRVIADPFGDQQSAMPIIERFAKHHKTLLNIVKNETLVKHCETSWTTNKTIKTSWTTSKTSCNTHKTLWNIMKHLNTHHSMRQYRHSMRRHWCSARPSLQSMLNMQRSLVTIFG